MKFDYNQISGFGEEVIGNLERQMTKLAFGNLETDDQACLSYQLP